MIGELPVKIVEEEAVLRTMLLKKWRDAGPLQSNLASAAASLPQRLLGL